MAEERKPAPKAAEPVDPENVQLSEERLEAIRKKAREIVAKDRLAALEKLALDKALEEIRGKEGLRTGDPDEDRTVDVTIDMGLSADSIVLNGRKFFHGQTYPMPVHQARTAMEIMYRTALHEHEISGKPYLDFYRKPHHTVVSRRGVANAPQMPGTPGAA